MSTERNHAIDTYKFLLSIVIVILHSNYKFCPQGYLAVESFFIIAGFFLVKSNVISLKESITKRLLAVGPLYIMAVFIMLVIDCAHGYFTLATQLPLYLSGLQVLAVKSMELNFVPSVGYLWFIPVYLHITLSFIIIIKHTGHKKFCFIAVAVFLLSIALLVYDVPYGGINYTIEKFNQPIPIGYLRGMMSVSFGYLCGFGFECCEKNLTKHYIAYSALELLLVGYIIWIFFQNVTQFYDFCYVISSGIFIGLICIKKGVISQTFDVIAKSRVLRYVIQSSGAIYVVHFAFVNEYIRKYGEYVTAKNLPAIIILSISSGVIVAFLNNIILQKMKDKGMYKK